MDIKGRPTTPPAPPPVKCIDLTVVCYLCHFPRPRPCDRNLRDVELISCRLRRVEPLCRLPGSALQQLAMCGFYEDLEKGVTRKFTHSLTLQCSTCSCLLLQHVIGSGQGRQTGGQESGHRGFINNWLTLCSINQLKYSEPVNRDGSGTLSLEDRWRCATTEHRQRTMTAKWVSNSVCPICFPADCRSHDAHSPYRPVVDLIFSPSLVWACLYK